MNIRRGLIGLFVLLFLLSSVSMFTLVMDDRKDLSSRASIGLVSHQQLSLDETKIASGTAIFQKSLSGGDQINIAYDSSSWLAPANTDKDLIFLNRRDLSSVRVLTGSLIQSSNPLSMDSNFVLVRKNKDTVSSQGWKISDFSYKFFGQDKNVQVWTKDKFTLIAILPALASSDSIDKFSQGISLGNNKVKGTSTSVDDSARLAALSRPSVVLILTNYCGKAEVASIPGTSISGKSYPFCLSATGTGFFVTPDGYIATNGHVTQIGPQTTLLAGVTTGQFNELLVDYTEAYLAQTGVVVPRDQIETKVKESLGNKDSLYQLAGALETLRQNNLLSFNSSDYKYFVQAGQTPIQISKNSGVNVGIDILSAKLIGFDYQEMDPKVGFVSSDVALLKVTGENFPALPLGSLEDITTGSELQIIGFPGVANGNNSFLLDASANAEPTITRGVVSALKKAKGDQKNLIQTDASINHGNSGGPAIDKDGKVIGIATYGLMPEEGGGNYNFLRDIGDLKSLMEKYNVTASTGKTYDTWKQGLDSFWLSYYRYAKTDFTQVESLYPIHPTVQKYISEAKSKAGTGEDKTPMFSRQDRRLYLTISGILMVISLLSIIGLSIADRLAQNKKKNIIFAPTNTPMPPVQTF